MKVTFLIMAVVGNILLLSYFKYISFFTDILNNVLHLSIHVEPIPLPIGISFYTFQAMSYVIDIYRKDGDVQKIHLTYIYLFSLSLLPGQLFVTISSLSKLKRASTLLNDSQKVFKFSFSD